MEFKTVDDILDFAIKNEEEASVFYTEMAGKMKNAAMVQVFKDFAHEEEGHKQKLLEIKAGKILLSSSQKIMDLKLADYIDTEVEIKGDLNYQDALLLAMRKEKKAFKMYSDLSARAQDESIRNILSGMAQEEAKHKLRFEIEYDELVFTEN